jgi:hypothetical protein
MTQNIENKVVVIGSGAGAGLERPSYRSNRCHQPLTSAGLGEPRH